MFGYLFMEVQELKKREYSRLNLLVERAMHNDPRIIKAKEDEKQAKRAKANFHLEAIQNLQRIGNRKEKRGRRTKAKGYRREKTKGRGGEAKKGRGAASKVRRLRYCVHSNRLE